MTRTETMADIASRYPAIPKSVAERHWRSGFLCTLGRFVRFPLLLPMGIAELCVFFVCVPLAILRQAVAESPAVRTFGQADGLDTRSSRLRLVHREEIEHRSQADPRSGFGLSALLYGHYAGNNKSFPDFMQKKEKEDGNK